MIAEDSISRGGPIQGHRAAIGCALQICRRGNRMHAQCRIAHQRNVNLARRAVDLILVQAARPVILRQPRAVTDGFAQAHVLQKPVWPA